MPLFTRQNRSVLFIHVPKTGGTSVEAFFARNGFAAELLDTGGPKSLNRYRRCPPQHMEAALLQAVLRPARCDYVFATVREPLARIVSEYRMRFRGVADAPGLPAWLDLNLKRYLDDPYVLDNHLRPQVEFLLPGCEVFRQEDGFGEALVGRVEQKLETQLEHRAFGYHKPEGEVAVTPEDIERVRPRVRTTYWRDYAAFGYA